LLASATFATLAPLASLAFTVRDLYPATHWALRGDPPGFDTPDEDVYLTGRNIALLSKAGVYCGQHRIERIAIGPLAGNPFPDATPQFFAAMARALSLGLDHHIEISAPLAAMHKSDVVRLGLDLGVPLALTLSCMNPANRAHCGRCSKCRERRDAFDEAGVADPTEYATAPLR
jgi:7-cyano-7-deazaguanine synthase